MIAHRRVSLNLDDGAASGPLYECESSAGGCTLGRKGCTTWKTKSSVASMATLRIALAQINLTVGDIEGNATRIAGGLERARRDAVDIVLFPELTLTGYPPEDLLLKPGFLRATR